MPGAGKQGQAVQDQIRDLLESGVDPTTIHKRLGVGRSSVYRMRRSIAQYGTPYSPPELNRKNGRPKTLSKDQERDVCEWLREPKNRDGYLDHMVMFIYETFEVVVSTTTCSKMKRKWLQVIDAQERGEVPPDPDTIEVVIHRGPNAKPRKRKSNATASAEADGSTEDLSYAPPPGQGQQGQETLSALGSPAERSLWAHVSGTVLDQ